MKKIVRVPLDQNELSIIIQCIQMLNFQGKDVIPVGMLGGKLIKELSKLELEPLGSDQKRKIENESTK